MKRPWLSILLVGSAGLAALPAGCGGSKQEAAKTFSAQDLRDPSKCEPCHDSHYNDWAQSMHKFASDDPVFLAMNARGQRETNGQLGTFCVQCHAPLAVKDGLTTDGLNLASLPATEKGVTCYFCHQIDSVGATHVNADVTLANDLVMRGEIMGPQDNPAHASAYSQLHDEENVQSAALCGNCHDIQSQAGGEIERTYTEWQNSFFGVNHDTCAFEGNCHMTAVHNTNVALNGPTTRTLHKHDFPAVDIAVDPTFPDPATQQATIESTLSTTLQGALCVNIRGGVRVILDDVGAAHDWPSGAAQDRRAWVEVVASKGGTPFYSSGTVPAGTPVGQEPNDPDLWLLRDQMFDATGNPVDNFWQAACATGDELLPIYSTDPTDPKNYTHRVRLYPNTPSNPGDSVLPQLPDMVTATVHLQAIGLDVIDDLVSTGDLAADAGVAANIPTLTVALPNPTEDGGIATSLTWTPQTAISGFIDATQGAAMLPMSCVTTLNFNVNATTPFASDPPKTCSAPVGDAGP